MKAATTAERLKKIMQERNIKQSEIIEKAQPYCEKYGVKLGKNDLSQYVNGKVEPGQKKLSILALALNVNEAWLMGYEVPIELSNKSEYESILAEKSASLKPSDAPVQCVEDDIMELAIKIAGLDSANKELILQLVENLSTKDKVNQDDQK